MSDHPLYVGHIEIGKTPPIRLQVKDPEATSFAISFVQEVATITLEDDQELHVATGMGCGSFRLEVRGRAPDGESHAVVVNLRELLGSMVEAWEGLAEGG